MENNDQYNTLSEDVAEGFYSEKRSKFYAFAFHVETEEQVHDIVQTYRKRFYDARHVCYAFMLGADGALSRTNDDGEPSSTAGKPILGQIVKNGLTDVLIIVVRYFGGVQLGTGGLIVAYKAAAADALEHAVVETRLVEEDITFDFSYIMMNDVMKVVKDMKPTIVSQTFDNTCQVVLRIRKTMAPQLKKRLEMLAFQ